MRRAFSLLLLVLVMSGEVSADGDLRILAVREGATARLAPPAAFKVLRIRGYSIDVRIGGARKKLKIGQSFAPKNAACTLIFEEISPETRIARFATDCQ